MSSQSFAHSLPLLDLETFPAEFQLWYNDIKSRPLQDAHFAMSVYLQRCIEETEASTTKDQQEATTQFFLKHRFLPGTKSELGPLATSFPVFSGNLFSKNEMYQTLLFDRWKMAAEFSGGVSSSSGNGGGKAAAGKAAEDPQQTGEGVNLTSISSDIHEDHCAVKRQQWERQIRQLRETFVLEAKVAVKRAAQELVPFRTAQGKEEQPKSSGTQADPNVGYLAFQVPMIDLNDEEGAEENELGIETKKKKIKDGGGGNIHHYSSCLVNGFVIQIWKSRNLARMFASSLTSVVERGTYGPPVFAPFSVAVSYLGLQFTATLAVPLMASTIPAPFLQLSKTPPPEGSNTGKEKKQRSTPPPTSTTPSSVPLVRDVIDYLFGCQNSSILVGNAIPNTANAPETIVSIGADGRIYVLNILCSFTERMYGKIPTPAVTRSIKKLAQYIDNVAKDKGGSLVSISALAHQHTVPIRFLGNVYLECKNEGAKCFVLNEMCSRAIRDIWGYDIYRNMQDLHESRGIGCGKQQNKMLTESENEREELWTECNVTSRILCHAHEESNPGFWIRIVLPHVTAKFNLGERGGGAKEGSSKAPTSLCKLSLAAVSMSACMQLITKRFGVRLSTKGGVVSGVDPVKGRDITFVALQAEISPVGDEMTSPSPNKKSKSSSSSSLLTKQNSSSSFLLSPLSGLNWQHKDRYFGTYWLNTHVRCLSDYQIPETTKPSSMGKKQPPRRKILNDSTSISTLVEYVQNAASGALKSSASFTSPTKQATKSSTSTASLTFPSEEQAVLMLQILLSHLPIRFLFPTDKDDDDDVDDDSPEQEKEGEKREQEEEGEKKKEMARTLLHLTELVTNLLDDVLCSFLTTHPVDSKAAAPSSSSPVAIFRGKLFHFLPFLTSSVGELMLSLQRGLPSEQSGTPSVQLATAFSSFVTGLSPQGGSSVDISTAKAVLYTRQHLHTALLFAGQFQRGCMQHEEICEEIKTSYEDSSECKPTLRKFDFELLLLGSHIYQLYTSAAGPHRHYVKVSVAMKYGLQYAYWLLPLMERWSAVKLKEEATSSTANNNSAMDDGTGGRVAHGIIGETIGAYIQVAKMLLIARQFQEALKFIENALRFVAETEAKMKALSSALWPPPEIYLKRLRGKIEYRLSRKPELIIQEAVRNFLKRLAELRKIMPALQLIQAVGRASKDRVEIRRCWCVATMQRMGRCVLEKRILFRLKRTAMLQRVGRAYFSGRRKMPMYAVRKIQTFGLAYLSRKMQGIRRSNYIQAAKLIQRVGRNFMENKSKIVPSYLQQRSCKRLLCRVTRGCVVRRYLYRKLCKKTVTRIFHGFKERIRLGFLYNVVDHASHLMQRVGRCFLIRRKFSERYRFSHLSVINQSCWLLQNVGRGYATRRLFGMRLNVLRHSQAIQYLMKTSHGYSARKKVGEIHGAYLSYLFIQRVLRGFRARRRLGRTLQRIIKEKYSQGNKVLQKCGRGLLARLTMRKLQIKMTKIRRIVSIQKLGRGHQCRNFLEKYKVKKGKQEVGLAILQRMAKFAWSRRVVKWKLFFINRRTIYLLQRVGRGYAARKVTFFAFQFNPRHQLFQSVCQSTAFQLRRMLDVVKYRQKHEKKLMDAHDTRMKPLAMTTTTTKETSSSLLSAYEKHPRTTTATASSIGLIIPKFGQSTPLSSKNRGREQEEAAVTRSSSALGQTSSEKRDLGPLVRTPRTPPPR